MHFLGCAMHVMTYTKHRHNVMPHQMDPKWKQN